jgi:hypothetical protein
MPSVIINGRRVNLPESATDADIRRAGGVRDGRTVIKRSREGNFLIPPGSSVDVNPGDTFVDAPSRVKGGRPSCRYFEEI